MRKMVGFGFFTDQGGWRVEMRSRRELYFRFTLNLGIRVRRGGTKSQIKGGCNLLLNLNTLSRRWFLADRAWQCN